MEWLVMKQLWIKYTVVERGKEEGDIPILSQFWIFSRYFL